MNWTMENNRPQRCYLLNLKKGGQVVLCMDQFIAASTIKEGGILIRMRDGLSYESSLPVEGFVELLRTGETKK